MKLTYHKVFFIWGFDKEERWLNEMAQKGLALVSVGAFTYNFEPCEPGEYIVRLELLENSRTNEKSEQYIRFVESTGAAYIGSILNWVYFRKKSTLGAFDLYSDYAHRIRHLNRVLLLIALLLTSMLFNGISFFVRYGTGQQDAFHLITGLIFAAFSAGGIYGLVRLLLMRRTLKREHELYE